MGHKINPLSFRIGITKNWSSRWFFSLNKKIGGKFAYAKFLEEDEVIRNTINEKIDKAGITAILIERTSDKLKVKIKAAKPGFIIGRGGKGIEDLTVLIEKRLGKLRGSKEPINLSMDVEELKRSEISSVYVAQQIAWDLEKMTGFRRTIKKYLEQLSQSRDVKGAKILVSGRLDGAEIARRETLKFGALPLQNLRADIDYGEVTAFTTYGTIGIKVWLYKGEVFSAAASQAKRANGASENPALSP